MLSFVNSHFSVTEKKRVGWSVALLMQSAPSWKPLHEIIHQWGDQYDSFVLCVLRADTAEHFKVRKGPDWIFTPVQLMTPADKSIVNAVFHFVASSLTVCLNLISTQPSGLIVDY